MRTGKVTPHTLRSTFNLFSIGATLQTIVAPASNTKGVIVLGAWVEDNNEVYVNNLIRIMAKSTAPTGSNDTAANTLAINGSGTAPHLGVALPVVLPPGVGLYAQATVLNANGAYGAEYEVL